MRKCHSLSPGDVGLTLEAEEGSCSYMKKEIGDGSPCTGDISQSEARRRVALSHGFLSGHKTLLAS